MSMCMAGVNSIRIERNKFIGKEITDRLIRIFFAGNDRQDALLLEAREQARAHTAADQDINAGQSVRQSVMVAIQSPFFDSDWSLRFA